jgi:odorant receptor
MAALISFSDFVGCPLTFFKVFGLAPQGNPPMKKWKRRLLEVWRCFSFFTLSIPGAFLVMFVRENLNDLPTLVKNVPPTGYLMMALVKTVCIYRKQKSFRVLLQDLEDMFPKTKEEQSIFKVENYLKKFRCFGRTIAVIIASGSLNFFLAKLIKFAVFGVWYDQKMPVDNWFPYDKYEPKLYNFTLAWSLSSAFFFIGGLIGSDLILYCIVKLISMQFDILSIRLQKLKPSDDKETLKELMEHHEKLLKMSKDLGGIFAPSILFNFVTSSLLICLVGYQVSVAANVEFIVLLVAALLQVLMLCYCGQMLTNAAENVATSIYDSDWGEDHKKMKTTLVMIMQRGQKETKLTALKFSVLNLAAFTTVSI